VPRPRTNRLAGPCREATSLYWSPPGELRTLARPGREARRRYRGGRKHVRGPLDGGSGTRHILAPDYSSRLYHAGVCPGRASRSRSLNRELLVLRSTLRRGCNRRMTKIAAKRRITRCTVTDGVWFIKKTDPNREPNLAVAAPRRRKHSRSKDRVRRGCRTLSKPEVAPATREFVNCRRTRAVWNHPDSALRLKSELCGLDRKCGCRF